MSKSVILSYFAQNPDQKYLNYLKKEYRQVKEAWLQHSIPNRPEYYEVFYHDNPFTQINDIPNDIATYQSPLYQKSIVLFHYGGHAGQKKIFLEDGQGQAVGLAGLLGGIDTLKLVFLNGCATYDQVALLFDKGVKVVIATNHAIPDSKAQKFASDFYNELAKAGITIQEAYNKAMNSLGFRDGVTRKEHMVWDRGLVTGKEEDSPLWELFVKQGNEELLKDRYWWVIGNLALSRPKPEHVSIPKLFFIYDETTKDNYEVFTDELLPQLDENKIVANGIFGIQEQINPVVIKAELHAADIVFVLIKDNKFLKFWISLQLGPDHLCNKNVVFIKISDPEYSLNALIKAGIKPTSIVPSGRWTKIYPLFDNAPPEFKKMMFRDIFDDTVKNAIETLPKFSKLKSAPNAELLSANGVENPNLLIGRERELIVIEQKLSEGHNLILINGEGGIGKTTLMASYWNENLHKYERTAWLFCGNGIMVALKEMAPKLNMDLKGMDEAQQFSALRHSLSQVHEHFLLVLDNANDPQDIRWFCESFAGFRWHVLITSRCQGILDPSQELSIPPLPPAMAKMLFIKYYNEDNPEFPILLDLLLEFIHDHTLLVELFAKNLSKASQLGLTLHDFLEKLKNGGLYLGEENNFTIETDFTHSIQKSANTFDATLDILYDFTTLTEEQRYVLVNLALLAAENYTILFLIEVLNPQDKKAFLNIIEALYQMGLITKANKTYRINPLVQEIVLKRNREKLQGDSKRILSNLAYKMGNNRYNFVVLTLSEIAPFAKLANNITQRLRKYPSPDLGKLSFNSALYFECTGDIVLAKLAFEEFGKISAEIGETENVATAHLRLGGIYEATGDWKNALENYKNQLNIYKDLSQVSPLSLHYKNGLAVSYQNIGNIYYDIGDWKESLENYKEHNRIALDLNKSSFENLDYKNGLAISNQNLGDIYKTLGDFKQALEKYEVYNQIKKEIHQCDPERLSYKNGLAISYAKLGEIYQATGDFKNALEKYQEYNQLAKEICQISPENLQYKNVLTVSYSKLGEIYQATGEFDDAMKTYEEYNRLALEIYKSSPENLEYKNGLAVSYAKLAEIYQAKRDIPQAIVSSQECNKLETEIYKSSPENLDYKRNLADSHELLGNVYQAAGVTLSALENYQQQLRIFTEIYECSPESLDYKDGLARSYQNVGSWYLLQNKDQIALNNFEVSADLSRGLWNGTKGEIIDYAYSFAFNSTKISAILKRMIQVGKIEKNEISQMIDRITEMRKTAYAALQPLFDRRALKYTQLDLVKELEDKSWYEF